MTHCCDKLGWIGRPVRGVSEKCPDLSKELQLSNRAEGDRQDLRLRVSENESLS